MLKQYRLFQTPQPVASGTIPNYPNPFNPETWIPYQLAEAADVTMTLYAADGRLVRTLGLGGINLPESITVGPVRHTGMEEMHSVNL